MFIWNRCQGCGSADLRPQSNSTFLQPSTSTPLRILYRHYPWPRRRPLDQSLHASALLPVFESLASLTTPLATMSTPQFFQTPFRFLRWASHEKPAIFYSFILGSMGPVCVFTVPPIRHRLGDPDRPPIPMTYPSKKLPNPVKAHPMLIRKHSTARSQENTRGL